LVKKLTNIKGLSTKKGKKKDTKNGAIQNMG
jgi:hypothetical protein